MELRQYAALVWGKKWLLILVMLLAATSAFVTSLLVAPVYEASTRLLISEAPISDYNAILASERLARTYAQLLAGRPVTTEALSQMGLDIDLEELEKLIDVRLIRDTQLIELTVEGTSPSLAAELANTIVQVFTEQTEARQASRYAASKASMREQLDRLNAQIEASEAAIASLGTPTTDLQREELERRKTELAQHVGSYTMLLQSYEELRIDEARAIPNVVQVEPAVPPVKPVRPLILLNTLLAVVFGAMLGAAAIFLIESLDDTIRTQEDAERVFQAPVLGNIPDVVELNTRKRRVADLTKEFGPVVEESFRQLVANLLFTGGPVGPRTILISSPGSDDGKTVLATRLAATIARAGKRVVLIDADLRRPGLHKILGIANNVGFSDMLIDDLVPQVAAHSLKLTRLKLITSGRIVDNPAELFGSMWLLKILANLREQADVVVFDAAPLRATETLVLASRLESVLLVLRPGQTSEGAGREVLQHMQRAQANLVGIVMNRVPKKQVYRLADDLYDAHRADTIKKESVSNQSGPAEPSSPTRHGKRGQVVLKKGSPTN